MFLHMLRPYVVDFLDEFTLDRVERENEVLIESLNVVSDISLKEVGIKTIDGTYVLAVKKRNGEVIFAPSKNVRLEKSDVIVIVGIEEDIKKIRKEKNGIV